MCGTPGLQGCRKLLEKDSELLAVQARRLQKQQQREEQQHGRQVVGFCRSTFLGQKPDSVAASLYGFEHGHGEGVLRRWRCRERNCGVVGALVGLVGAGVS